MIRSFKKSSLSQIAFRHGERALLILGLFASFDVCELKAHEGHQSTTYEVTNAWRTDDPGRHLRLRIVDESGQPIAARFSLTIDGEDYVPSQLGPNGLRFVSIHSGKRNVFVAAYSRGTGDVILPLPAGRAGSVTATRGFEYLASTESFQIHQNGATECTVVLRRWANLEEQGWTATDEHLHYERTDPRLDEDWMAMLDADGLSHAHFLVLKGGNVPGVWATQYAYGADGEARRGDHFIRSGEEYRDTAQGHINLLGLSQVIEPISTGGIGRSPRFNFPPLADVLKETRRLGGIGGPAHGGSLAKSSTAILDTVLGEVAFFEIANSHLYKTDVWYRLLNAGFLVPPVAGTDLPNFGYRDPWQPLFGEVRTYLRMGSEPGFRGWVDAIHRGEVFITSGPLIRLAVNGTGPGGEVRLPAGGGEIEVVAEVRSPRELHSLEVVQMGDVALNDPVRSTENGVERLSIRSSLRVAESCWIAARGMGGPKAAIEQGLAIKQSEIAHTGVIRVVVGAKPIRRRVDVQELRRHLVAQQEYYRSQGKFENSQDRAHMMRLFEQAIAKLSE